MPGGLGVEDLEDPRRERQRRLVLQRGDLDLEATTGRLLRLKVSAGDSDSRSYRETLHRGTALQANQRFGSYVRHPRRNRSGTGLELFSAMRRTYTWNLHRARDLLSEERRGAAEQAHHQRRIQVRRIALLALLGSLVVPVHVL